MAAEFVWFLFCIRFLSISLFFCKNHFNIKKSFSISNETIICFVRCCMFQMTDIWNSVFRIRQKKHIKYCPKPELVYTSLISNGKFSNVKFNFFFEWRKKTFNNSSKWQELKRKEKKTKYNNKTKLNWKKEEKNQIAIWIRLGLDCVWELKKRGREKKKYFAHISRDFVH